MRQIVLFLYLVLCGVIIFSCNNINQKKFEFFYYPSRNIYFDVADNFYLYSLDGGKTWDSINVNSNKQPATLGEKKIIYSTTSEVWLNNQQHLTQYNGHAIDITANDSSMFEAALAADRKAKKPKATAPSSSIPRRQQSEKKAGFFQRLFGKKHK
ncbi:MAG: hypothetical protein JO072_06585 [Parafilimonas sp.]|nr:hypothetical protein [Parafilimonas sp.]